MHISESLSGMFKWPVKLIICMPLIFHQPAVGRWAGPVILARISLPAATGRVGRRINTAPQDGAPAGPADEQATAFRSRPTRERQFRRRQLMGRFFALISGEASRIFTRTGARGGFHVGPAPARPRLGLRLRPNSDSNPTQARSQPRPRPRPGSSIGTDPTSNDRR